MATTKKCAPPM